MDVYTFSCSDYWCSVTHSVEAPAECVPILFRTNDCGICGLLTSYSHLRSNHNYSNWFLTDVCDNWL
jgi:hypothetical protein